MPPTTAPTVTPERLPLPRLFGYGVQHILSMFGGVIAVPIIIGNAAGLSARRSRRCSPALHMLLPGVPERPTGVAAGPPVLVREDERVRGVVIRP